MCYFRGERAHHVDADGEEDHAQPWAQRHTEQKDDMATRARQPGVPTGTFGSGRPDRPETPDPKGQEASEASVRSALRPPPLPGARDAPMRLSDVEPVALPPLASEKPAAVQGPSSGRFDKGEHPLRDQSDEQFALELEDLVASFDLPPVPPPPHIPEVPPPALETPVTPATPPPLPSSGTSGSVAATPSDPTQTAPVRSAEGPAVRKAPPPLPIRGPAPVSESERSAEPPQARGPERAKRPEGARNPQERKRRGAPMVLGGLLLIGLVAFALVRLAPGPGPSGAARPGSARLAPPAPVSSSVELPASEPSAVSEAVGALPPASTAAVASGRVQGAAGTKGDKAREPRRSAASRQARAAAGRPSTARRRKAAPPAEQTVPGLPETPSRADIVRGFATVLPAVKACAKGMSGVAQVTASIAGSGRVRHAVVTGPFHGTKQGSCVARAVRKAKFPQFQTKTLKVDYPFVL